MLRNKKEYRKTKDATNHMGERQFDTYEAWKRAVKQIDPNVRFDGNKDICQGGNVGEWDGAHGIIYSKDSTKDTLTKESYLKKYNELWVKVRESKNREDKEKILEDIEALRKQYQEEGYNKLINKFKDTKDIKINETPDSEFDAKELALGIKTEMEHTDNLEEATSIAKDHLQELPDYYTKLVKMEKTKDIGTKQDYKKRDENIRKEIDWSKALWECPNCGRKNGNQFATCPRCGKVKGD